MSDWPPLGTTDSGGPLFSDDIDVKITFDGEADGYHYADSLSVEAAVDRLRDSDVDAAFVYLGEIDVVAHETDSFSPEYKAAIEWADTRVGLLLQALRDRPTYDQEDWLILHEHRPWPERCRGARRQLSIRDHDILPRERAVRGPGSHRLSAGNRGRGRYRAGSHGART